MKESYYVDLFFSITDIICKDIKVGEFFVKKQANLLYQICINPELKIDIKDITNPLRGSSAFQTDLCIFEKINEIDIPRVVIEFKTNYTTHDVLTYSAKAGKHKQIYPYLRYGLISTALPYITGRFFTHNENLDFVLTTKRYNDNKTAIRDVIHKLVVFEIDKSIKLEEIYFNDSKNDYFSKDIIFKNIV